MVTPLLTACKRLLFAVPAIALAACSTTQPPQSFVVNQDSAVEASMVATDADFSTYNRLHAVDMGIFSPESAVTTADDLERIRTIFRSAFLSELEDYEIVTEPGPGAMTVQATLIDFRNASNTDLMSVRRELRDMAAPGKMIFLMELKDSETDRILGRAADSAKTPSIADEEGEVTDWASVEDAAAHWAALFHTFLDENFGK